MQQLNRFIQIVTFTLLGSLFLAAATGGANARPVVKYRYQADPDTSGSDTSNQLPFPFDDRDGDFYTDPDNDPLNLNDPSIIDRNITYDPETGDFRISESIGDQFYRNPNYISFEDFLKAENERLNEDYFRQRSEGVNLLGRNDGLELFEDSEAIDRLFGGTNVEIRPQGNIELIFGFNYQNIENPTLPERARRQGNFDFDMNINMSVVGQIGDKMKLNTNYNTQATFDFENQVKLNYEGTEDEIVQLLEAGNVSFPLNSQLIQGSQSLFGIKSKLKFGRLTVTSVVSQQQSKRENITIQGGAQMRDFEIKADQYDENRHFFLGHYFRDNYEKFLSTMPVTTSPVMVTRIEVWVTNTTGFTQNTRDVVAFQDLAESDRIYSPNVTANPGPPIPYNSANNLYNQIGNTQGARSLSTAIASLQSLGYQPVNDFEKTRARKLNPTEYTLYPQLGYISLNQQLKPDEVLGVAFEFTYNGETYRVGEFSQDLPIDPNNQNVLFLKMLKATAARPRQPIWDLMMKNIYSLGAYQVNSEDFRLDLYYQDPGGGEKRYIPEGEGIKSRPLIRVMQLDRLNNQLDPQPDGIFDFVPGVTINPQNGRLIFPVVEPFGEFLENEFEENGNPENLADKYVYQILYDSTKFVAQQFPQFNRYVIRGTYKSSVSSEIYLGAFNIPRGSVTITAGGQRLREGVDYTIDYNLGRVKIINDGIMNSGVPINVSYENNATFGFLTKTMIGNRFDYWVNDNLTIGGTHMFLSERPFTQKVNFGDDPIANNIYGVDVAYNKDLPGLTQFLDQLPLIETEATSNLDFAAEAAFLQPGHSRAINQNRDSPGGFVYIDDFEGSRNAYDLRFPLWSWSLASTPSGALDDNGNERFPEAKLFDSLAYGYNRAKTVWYNLDPVFQANNSATPDYIQNNPSTQSNHYVRIIDEREIFPRRENPNLLFTQIATFDLAYYPSLRGPYNYLAEKDGVPGIAAGINQDGTLKNPASRWGGIQRSIETNDFEQANVEYIDFWVMDPFDNTQPYGNVNGDGYLYINMGFISEDVMKDSRMFFENGLPRPSTDPRIDTTIWGRVPRTQVVVNAFDTDPDVLQLQDAGFDGFLSEDERNHHTAFLDKINQMEANGDLTPAAAQALRDDPSSDDFVAYLDPELADAQIGILERYLNFDGPEGNTAANTENDQFSQGSNLPNSEDLNQDNTLNENESYFEYKIPMFAGMDVSNHPYITDVVTHNASFRDGTADEVNWYHFQIPIREFTGRVGGIQDFRSIQFIRMYMTEFQRPVILRFAQLQLIRNQWMRYRFNLQSPGEYIPNDNEDLTTFNVNVVSVEENSSKEPIPYVLPPGVEREQFVGNNAGNTFLQNEQSLMLEVCGLQDGDSRAVFKTLNFDFRQYERMQLFLHAEAFTGQQQIQTEIRSGELWAFVRLGDDFTENYYEYALPLEITNPNDVSGGELERREAIWPEANLIDVLLDTLKQVKVERNDQGLSRTVPYEVTLANGHKITIIGNPNLGSVKISMIGLRNPKNPDVIGEDLCAEVWVNEFRLYGLNNQGGEAGVVRADLQLADLGTVSLAGAFHTIGFGQLEQKVNERFRDNFMQYDASTNLELGRLMPKEWGVSIPMYAGISNAYSRPEFDPYDFDIRVRDNLEKLVGDERREYLRQVQDFTSIKSLNFTNVRKNKTGGGKARPWDISNFNLTYAFSETFRSSPIIEYDIIRRHKGGLAYQYNTRTKYIEPFKKLIGRSKWLELIKDFNFNPIPNRFSFRTEMNRQYGETVLRDLYGDALLDTTHNKFWTWDRFYDMRWDITKSLKLDFNAANLARIDEPDGRIDTDAERDSIWTNILNLGRNTNYRHTITLNYNLPTSKFPLTDWINARAAYSADYEWEAASLVVDSLGNTLRNSRNIRLNADGNLSRLYNKIDILKRANQRTRRRSPSPRRRGSENSEEQSKEENSKDDDKGGGGLHPALKTALQVVTGLKRASVNYTRTEGTVLPGYEPETEFMGLRNWTAPGWEFITGYQPDSFDLNRYAANGWIVQAQTLPFQHTQTLQENFDMRITVEPLPDMRIDLNWKSTYQENFAEFFRWDPVNSRYVHQNPMDQGSYSITFNALNTLFDPVDTAGFSETYLTFEERRKEVSRILGDRNPYSNGTFFEENSFDTLNYPEYSDGYGPYAIDVLVPAFLSSYTGIPVEEIGFNLFNIKPKPNWRFTYNGLSKIGPLSEIFQNFNITHAYNSQLTINSFQTDFNYEDSLNTGWPSARDSIAGNFYPIYTVPQIMLSEQFAPLIGLDITLQNGLTARVEYKKSRQVMLNLVDYQMIETKSTEVTIGGGYRVKGVKLPFKIRGKEARLENDLNFRFDFSLRDDRTNNYVLDQNTSEPTQGALTYTISPQVDYVINDRLNIRLFFDHRRTEPYTSASFPISNTNGGIAIRFTLAE